MALSVARNGRHRPSIGASRGLTREEESSETVALIRQLRVIESDTIGTPDLADVASQLQHRLRVDPQSASIFRHAEGFEAVLSLIATSESSLAQSSSNLEEVSTALTTILPVLGQALYDQSGNQKYFGVHLKGWEKLEHCLQTLQEAAASTDESTSCDVLSRLYGSQFALALGNSVLHADINAWVKRDDDAKLTADAGRHPVQLRQPVAIAVRLALRLFRREALEDGVSLIGKRSIQIAAALARSNTRSRAALWQTDVLADLFEVALDRKAPNDATAVVQDLAFSLIEFGLLRLDSTARLFQLACESDDAQKMLLQALHSSKGPPFVQIDLSISGYSSIELQSLPRTFPPTAGWSLSLWLRVDSFDENCHTTLFGAFDTSQACFVLLYLEKDSHQLILQTSIRSNRPSVRFKSFRFGAGRWYHVAVVQQKLMADPRQSPAALFVDGAFCEQIKCAYPENPAIADERITAAGPITRRTKPVQAFFGTPHDLAVRIGRNKIQSAWSLGNARLYQVALTDEFIAVQHKLGARYAGNFQDCLGPLLTYQASAELNRYNELLHPERSERSDIITATEQRGADVVGESKLLISFSPNNTIILDDTNSQELARRFQMDQRALKKCDGLSQKVKTISINGAIPNVNDAVTHSCGIGILTGDPLVVIPRALDEATWRLTGTVPVLIRMLEAAKTKTAFIQATKIFLACVKDDWRISEAMEKGNGYGIFALVIREKLNFETGAAHSSPSRKPSSPLSPPDRQELPSELLPLILEFVGFRPDKPETSMIVNPMAYRVFLVDYDTWRRCDLETQTLYYSQFSHFAISNLHQVFNQKRLLKMRVVRKLIEALKHEDFTAESVPFLLDALKALLKGNGAWVLYRDLALFVTFALQDERALLKPTYGLSGGLGVRQHRGTRYSNGTRSSRPNTPLGPSQDASPRIPLSQLAVEILELLADVLCRNDHTHLLRRFYDSRRGMPSRWTLHLLAESNVRIVETAMRIICASIIVLGSDFKASFIDKNAGFITLKSRLKLNWRSAPIWCTCWGLMFGCKTAWTASDDVTAFAMVEALKVDEQLSIQHPEILPAIMAMLEAGLRSVIRDDQRDKAGIRIMKVMIEFLNELYARSGSFRDFAVSSRYMQSLLFVLYPVLVGSDRLAAEAELNAVKDSLSFQGQEVKMRPHSNSMGERPPSVRSLNIGDDQQKPSKTRNAVARPRRLSSFVLVSNKGPPSFPAQFQPALEPRASEPVKMNVGNATVESLLELVMNLIIDIVCTRRDFQGIGLFLKVPPGFREHQAYFESYILVNTLTQLGNHLRLNQRLLAQTKTLTNLAKYCQHMAEALFEGWFIDGAQPVLEFSGQILEFLQQPEIAALNEVRLCSHQINAIRVVFLRVTLWRLAELDESHDETEAVTFLNQMNYWQTILFSAENQETLFLRLICFVLYMKLVSEKTEVRLAAARLWRTVLVQKPNEAATLLMYAVGSDQRHLATGFMKLVSVEDDEFIAWIDENRTRLDTIFVDALKKQWDDFVNDENKRNEETAKGRLAKRREKLRLWHSEEASAEIALHRYESTTKHWQSNVHSQERLRLQRALQDQQESISHLATVFSAMEASIRQPSGIEPTPNEPKWRLDETEAANRMRMRIVPDSTSDKEVYQPKRRTTVHKPAAINTQIGQLGGDSILSAAPDGKPSPFPAFEDELAEAEVGQNKSDSVSNSQLLEGGFEMVDDPNEGDDGLVEDKNRKILTSLQRGDECQQLYNISRIVGLEACEGLLIVGKQCLYMQDSYFQRSDGEIIGVSQALPDERDPYVQLISGKDVGQSKSKMSISEQETRHWTWREVLSVSKRRFLFRDVSLEIFFTDGRSYLLTCMSSKIRDDLYSAILARAPHVHSASAVASEDAWRLDTLRNPVEAPQSFGSKFASVFNSASGFAATKKWIRGEMSNFQYLMLLNTMAGRTFNDLTQYPVFPWVLADYTSQELDLESPKTFRDLSKPMGCQTPQREAEFRDRYQQFADMGDQNAPPFHYGTHYSSAMIVTSYLIRLQPFVQSYLLLQGGTFDHADRLFDSIEKAWVSASRETMSDVRELTPEFFYLPEFLENVNHYDFGMKQGGQETVNNVRLPPWAKGDPRIFVTKHREALESPYVSENLHRWIDLIFGFKQLGEAAIEATNVFQHLSYRGAKDLDAIDDPVERLASIGIIHSFGQTPHQIFQRPHPAREVLRGTTTRMDRSAESLVRLPDPILKTDELIADLTFSVQHERLLSAGPGKLNLLPHSDRHLQWGFADHSLRFFSSNTNRLLGLFENIHVGPISVATFGDSKTLITGGLDCTIGLWTIKAARDAIELTPKTYLFGHRDAITILAASRICSTLVSASADGQVLVWGLNRLQCIRKLHAEGSPPIQHARISEVTGHILLCQGPNVLLYTLNGTLLVEQRVCDGVEETITSCAFYDGVGNEWLERELVFTGHPHGVVNVWTLTTLTDGSWHLQLIKRLNHTDVNREDGGNNSAPITSILPMATSVYTGDADGRVWQWECVQRATSLPRR